MARQTTKRNFVRRPGLYEAAEALGCNYSHLRRVVTGQRASKTLMRRFREFKETGVAIASPGKGRYLNSSKAAQPFISQAAADNLSPAFFAVLNKLGLELVIVKINAERDSAIWKHPQVEGELGAELLAAQAGHYDSSHYEPGLFWHFFHVADKAKAMQTLKDGLAARGLLESSAILHAETTKDFQIWYPPMSAGLQHIATET